MTAPKTLAVSGLRSALKQTAALADLVAAPPAGITILIYHRVGSGSGGQMDLAPEVFERQLAWLAATQRIITLDAAADEIGDIAGPSSPGVVLTFDDGTTDWLTTVLPALTRHGVPATFYVSTDFVDRGVPFPADGQPLDWGSLHELASSDLVTIGNHTHRHLLLDRLDPTAIDAELDTSQQLLGEHLGAIPEHFAYPKAVAGSPAAEAAVRARFRTAVLAGTRPNDRDADLHRLSRSPVQPSDGQRWFQRKALGGMHLEDDVRRAANRLRYRK
ncbi:MAG: polysaccharide deacetylase family protein, partial [Actinomycetes bacterium]